MDTFRTNKYNFTKEDLQKYYWEHDMSMDEIASMYGCTQGIVKFYMIRFGIPRRNRHEANSGRHNGLWKGGKSMLDGYVLVHCPSHPNAYNNSYVFEHRLVMEEKLGRVLEPGEFVHHINGVKEDNRPENLELVTSPQHTMMTIYCNHCQLRTDIMKLKHRICELEELITRLEIPI